MQYALKFPLAYNVPSVGSQTVPFTILLKCISKGPLGASLVSMELAAQIVLLSRTCRSLNTTNRTLPKYNIFLVVSLTNKDSLLVALMALI
eukprot:1151233-Pelagomonas_calceolata.AAC.4